MQAILRLWAQDDNSAHGVCLCTGDWTPPPDRCSEDNKVSGYRRRSTRLSICAKWRRLNQPPPHRFGRGLSPGRHAKLIEDVLHFAFDARFAPAKLATDLVVAIAGRHAAQHLNVLIGQA